MRYMPGVASILITYVDDAMPTAIKSVDVRDYVLYRHFEKWQNKQFVEETRKALGTFPIKTLWEVYQDICSHQGLKVEPRLPRAKFEEESSIWWTEKRKAK